MKQFSTRVLAAGLSVLACGAVVAAETSLTGNVALTSDYRFRGISQSAKDPALQGGVDYAHQSGFYLGAWGSTIDFDAGPGADPDASVEVDLYGGYKWQGAGVDWDAGLIHYAYPGSDGDFDLPFTELYLGGGYGPVSVKYFYTNDYTGPTDEGAYYLTAAANFELGSGYSLGLSLGQSGGDGIEESFGDSYMDYKIGVSKEFAGFGFNLAYVDTDLDPEITTDVFNSEGVVVLTVSKTF